MWSALKRLCSPNIQNTVKKPKQKSWFSYKTNETRSVCRDLGAGKLPSQEQGCPPASQETQNFSASEAGGVVSVECQEHAFLTVQLGGLLLPTPWQSWKLPEEESALCSALWEQVAIPTKLQHWKITRWYQPFFKAGKQKIRRRKKKSWLHGKVYQYA